MLRTLFLSPQCLPLCQSNFESNYPSSRTPVALNLQSELKLYNMDEEFFSLQDLPCLIPAPPSTGAERPSTHRPACLFSCPYLWERTRLPGFPSIVPKPQLGTLILILRPFALLSTRPVCYGGVGAYLCS